MGNDQFKSVNFISARTGEGKSTLVANTALASARTGKRVLLVDADFGSQASSKLLVDGWDRPGMTDLVLDKADLQSSVSVAALRDAGTLHVMGRGTQNVTAPDFFANPRLEDLMSRLESLYDLVLIDGPPLLQVAYASTVARLADALVIVVPHGSRGRYADELSKRVKLIETPVIGYLYNQGPRKAGRDTSGGSMKDILGDQGLTVTAQTERTR
jgi:Mrp family chromosome partitioning ATPase